MGWQATFTEPIPLPKGKPLTTLREATHYITKLPKKEHADAAWQAAREALILVADDDGAHRRHAGVESARSTESLSAFPN